MKEEVEEIKSEVKEIKEKSWAMLILEDYKKANRRMFIILIIVIAMWFATIGAFLYYINTTGFEETIETAETTDGGNACVGDNCNNGEITYGEGN